MTEYLKRSLPRESGQGLVELIVALMVLAIGIGSLLTLLTSSALSLQRSGQKGTALVLAEKQIELYRSVGYRDVRLDDASVSAIPATDPYVTANSSDPTIPSASGQILDTASDTNPCTTPLPDQCKPIQTVTGPDHRSYRIDTYIDAASANGGDTFASVTVIVRNANIATLPILARSASTFAAINVANVTGKSIVKLAFSAPRADLTGTQVDASSISATLSNTNAATGLINFYVLPAPASPSSPCSSGWQSLGPANVDGDGTYHPASSYTPPTAGTYYWYATYTGDSQNKKASSICGLSMASMKVQASKWSPSLNVSTSSSVGFLNTPISGSALTATLSGSSGTTTGAITYMVYGPSATAPGSLTCTTTPGPPGLWSQIGTVTPTGDGAYNPATGFTPTSLGTYWYYASFAADGTNNSAASTCGSSMAKTVVTVQPDTFGIATIGSQNAGANFKIATITAQLPGLPGGTDTTYSGTKTLTFTGPGTSPKGNAPTYPVSVTFTNGIATNVSVTLYKAETTTLNVTQGLISGTSNSFTVAGKAAAGFTVDSPATTPVAGTAFGVTVRAVDAYGNPASYSKSVTLSWANPGNAPNGKGPDFASTATSLSFSDDLNGQGFAIATGINLYNASNSTSLKPTESSPDVGFTGTSANFTVKAADAISLAFINCTLPSSANTTCAGSPLSTGNNGTLQANVALKDAYGNIAVATTAGSITVTSGSTANYTVSPSPVSIVSGGSQSNQFTVTPATNNPAQTTITAHVQLGGSWSDATIQVKK